jgi:hypothetical protein
MRLIGLAIIEASLLWLFTGLSISFGALIHAFIRRYRRASIRGKETLRVTGLLALSIFLLFFTK